MLKARDPGALFNELHGCSTGIKPPISGIVTASPNREPDQRQPAHGTRMLVATERQKQDAKTMGVQMARLNKPICYLFYLLSQTKYVMRRRHPGS